MNFSVVVSQFPRPVTNLNARVQYKPGKNNMTIIRDLMKKLSIGKQQYSTMSSITSASDYEYCMDKVPIHKMLLKEAFIPRMIKFFILSTISFVINLLLLVTSFIYIKRLKTC